MAQQFDYDAIVIGSGFGGSVAASRAVEKGYRGDIIEPGKRWRDDGSPFAITTGIAIHGPAIKSLNVYDVRAGEGSIQLRA